MKSLAIILQVKKFKEFCKKVLTKGRMCGNIDELRQATEE